MANIDVIGVDETSGQRRRAAATDLASKLTGGNGPFPFGLNQLGFNALNGGVDVTVSNGTPVTVVGPANYLPSNLSNTNVGGVVCYIDFTTGGSPGRVSITIGDTLTQGINPTYNWVTSRPAGQIESVCIVWFNGFTTGLGTGHNFQVQIASPDNVSWTIKSTSKFYPFYS